MASLHWAQLCTLLAVFVAGVSSKGVVQSVTWENFSSVQEGEWMIEFFAPWCPACQQFASTWETFAEHMINTDLKVGNVDITAETMLSGRFMVTHLPSVFHVKDGEVRQYEGDRSLNDLMNYVKDERWSKTDPIPAWKSPTAAHMYLVGTIFWFSERAREMQEVLEKDYELPTYAIFILIAVATIVFGLVLGGVTVCTIELCLRCCSRGGESAEDERKKPEKTEKKPEAQPQPTSTKGAQPTKAKAGVASGSPRKGGAAEGSGVRKRKGGGGSQ